MIHLKPGLTKKAFFQQVALKARQAVPKNPEMAKEVEVLMLREFLRECLIATPAKIKKNRA